MKRTMDATFLNSVANHADVRPCVGGAGEINLSPVLANPANVGFVFEHGGFVVIKLSPGVYECHSMFLPEGRGVGVLDAMRASLRYMFAETDCVEIVTKCPEGNKGALGAARVVGFRQCYRLEHGWQMADGAMSAVDIMSLSLLGWMQRDDEVEERGKWFHERLEEITEAAGKKIPVHYDEPAHNKAVGAAVLMYEAGNVHKATHAYNLWAQGAGFPQIKMISASPVILDMDQAIIAIRNNDMELLSCR